MSIVVAMMVMAQAIPLTDPATWSAGASYPPVAMRNGDTGSVEYELKVHASGDIAGCKIVTSSGSSVLDEATCEHVRRVARFKPSVTGSAETSSYRGHMRWVLDEAEIDAKPITMVVAGLAPQMSGSKTIVMFGIDANGRVSDCTIVSSSGDEKLDRSGCEIIAKKARFTPPEKPEPEHRVVITWR